VHAVNYFVHNFLCQPHEIPEVGHEYTCHILIHWQFDKQDSCLSMAIQAFAHAVFGRKRKLPEAVVEAKRLAEVAVDRVNAEVKEVGQWDERDGRFDQLMLAIMLMGSFEVNPFPFDSPIAVRHFTFFEMYASAE